MKSFLSEKMLNQSSCLHNCSSHGVCIKGVCTCSIQYTGVACDQTNLHYYISFSSFFYLICLTAFMQLILRMRMEHTTSRTESTSSSSSNFGLWKLDSQKLIYVFVICATGSRAVYFILGLVDYTPDFVNDMLFFMFYPFIFSIFSIIICFWAESFHLSGLQFDKPRFLTKSFCGFAVWNAVVYIIFISHVIANKVLHLSVLSKINIIFNACLALFMFCVLVFFLIYGVEIFYKIKGAFKKDESLSSKNLNYDQLIQSRFGLMIEAVFQLALTMFFVYEVLGRVYPAKMTVADQNIMNIVFHVVELGCIAWFPCCLWNVYKPGKLWILNPRNLLAGSKDGEPTAVVHEQEPIVHKHSTYGSSNINFVDELDHKDVEQFATSSKYDGDGFAETTAAQQATAECWICLSDENPETMIQPCKCKGGTKLVHHSCLKNWLIEKPSQNILNEEFKCDICKTAYIVETDAKLSNASKRHQFMLLSRVLFILMTLAAMSVSLYFIWYRVEKKSIKCVIFFGFFLAEYCVLRLLGCNVVKVYNVAKKSALVIVDSPVGTTT